MSDSGKKAGHETESGKTESGLPAASGETKSYRDLAFKVSDDELGTIIERYTRDLTELSRLGKFDPVIGREREVDELVTILLQRGRSNAVLLGPAGVGKTALFLALAQTIVAGNVPKMLKDARVIEAELSTFAAGTATRGEFEGRLIPFLKGVAERNASKKYPPIIICIDELHTIMPNCHATAASGMSDIMKPYLTTGDLQVVGATTRDEFNQFIRPDAALERRFQKVYVEEPTIDDTIYILKKLKSRYETHFDLKISDEICERLVRSTTKYLRKQTNPDKSIITLDQACAHAVKAGHQELTWASIAQTIGTQIGVVGSAIE